jgi:glycine oxidase
MADVVVVGGGAIGCAAALYLSKAGARVTLLERADLAGEASGAAAGILSALSEEGATRSDEFQDFCIRALRAYAEVLPELEATGHDLRYRRTGILHLAMTPDEVDRLRERYRLHKKVSPDTYWVGQADIAKEEPEANPEALAAMVSPSEHYLDPQRLVLALADAARKHGARIITQQEVVRFQRRAGRVRAVRTRDSFFEGDTFLLAMGPWTARYAERLGSFVPVRPMRGQMVALAGPGSPLRRVIWGADAYLVPRERGMTFVGATVEDVGFRKRVTRTAVRGLKRAAVRLVPGLTYARELSAWAGLRPGSPDALPILGLLPGWRNVWVATGHFRNGILLAPITGQLMAESVFRGEPVEALAPFSPERFKLFAGAGAAAGAGRATPQPDAR